MISDRICEKFRHYLLKLMETLFAKLLSRIPSKNNRGLECKILFWSHYTNVENFIPQVVQTALKLANCNQQEMLFSKLESHFLPLASDVTGHHVIKIAFATATSQQKKLLQSKLSNEGVLLSLLASTSGTCIVQLLAEGEAGSASRVALVNFLLLQLSSIAVLPTALPFLQELLQSEVSSGLHPLATELSSYPCLPTLVHHPTGHHLLEALVIKDLGAPTLHIARWLLRHMEEVVKCPYAASLASNTLPIILSHVSDPNYSSMLIRCK